MSSSKGPESLAFDWGSCASGQHCVQVYEDESRLLDTLEGFVANALARGEFALVIATAAHRSSLRARMRAVGIDLDAAAARGHYRAVDAADCLARFMVAGAPDPARFEKTIHGLLAPAREGDRPVHAFCEMVALLWAQGNSGGTLSLERLWETLCGAGNANVFCAYPRIGATRDLGDSLAEVLALHGRRVLPA
ncbi:MAG TPA: MEDS domain-containing protein [Luteimonas sp.]|nr:MEDS domain-containing protein [Luteimonas sp.]